VWEVAVGGICTEQVPWCGAKVDMASIQASKRRGVDSSGGSDLRRYRGQVLRERCDEEEVSWKGGNKAGRSELADIAQPKRILAANNNYRKHAFKRLESFAFSLRTTCGAICWL
jgi:hypothetical protein